MSQFTEDLSRETEILQNLQPALNSFFTNYSLQTNTEIQRKGIDITATYNNMETTVDVKSQLDYINNPLDTFVLEIFSETNTQGSNNKGWFVNTELETDYYIFTRFPKVDQFEVDYTLDLIKYYPYEELSTVPSFMKESTQNSNVYAFDFTEIDTFCKEYYPINKDKIFGNSMTGRFFTRNSIREQDALLLKKDKIRKKLSEMGLTKDVLLEDATSVDESGKNKSYSHKNIHKMHVSNRNGERPINLVVDYEFYLKVAEEGFIVEQSL